VAYLKLIFSKLPGSIDASDDLQRLAGVLWRWIASIPDTRIAIFTSQFITVRPIVALLGSPSGTRGPKDRAAQKLLDLVEQNAQVRGLPLVFFARLIVRAVKRGDGKAFAEVVKAFGPLLEKDAEMLRWIRRIESMYFKAGQPAGGDGGLANLGAMINEVIGSLSRPT
jgi:hypothetical protein